MLRSADCPRAAVPTFNACFCRAGFVTSERGLLFQGCVDQCIQIAEVGFYFYRLDSWFGTDYIDGRGVVEADTLAEILVLGDLRFQLALGIDREGQADFVGVGEGVGIGAEVAGVDLRLVGEEVVAELVAEIFRGLVEVARDDRGLEGPVVFG